ncbi:hypothetical protein CF319_g9085 [Tilletia indica]|nr:hypothetical protein CF319_g9085 [Tilletia indica]
MVRPSNPSDESPSPVPPARAIPLGRSSRAAASALRAAPVVQSDQNNSAIAATAGLSPTRSAAIAARAAVAAVMTPRARTASSPAARPSASAPSVPPVGRTSRDAAAGSSAPARSAHIRAAPAAGASPATSASLPAQPSRSESPNRAPAFRWRRPDEDKLVEWLCRRDKSGLARHHASYISHKMETCNRMLTCLDMEKDQPSITAKKISDKIGKMIDRYKEIVKELGQSGGGMRRDELDDSEWTGQGGRAGDTIKS